MMAESGKEDELGGNDESLGTAQENLEGFNTKKGEDEQFLADLTQMCADKTKAYEDRKMVRANEEAAVAQAISILNSDAAFDTFGSTKAASEGATGFLQISKRNAAQTSVRRQVQHILTKAARKHKSLKLAKIAVQVEKNPFAMVINSIKRQIQVIDEEEKKDDDQKAFCDSERTTNDEQIADKNAAIDRLTGDIDSLNDEIDNPETGLKKVLADNQQSLAETKASQAESTSDRQAENAEYQKNIANLVEAQKIIEKAHGVLSKFYDWLKAKQGPHHYDEHSGKDSGGSNIKRIPEATTEQLEEACSADPSCNGFNTDGWLKTKIDSDDKLYDTRSDLYVKVFDEESKVSFSLLQRREDPAPPESFSDGGSNYEGQTGKANDVVSQLEFIISESKAEERQAHTDEESAQHNFEDEMTTLKSQEQTSTETIASLEQTIADEEKSLQNARDDHEKTEAEKKAIQKYLWKIRPGCTFITDNIDARKSNRALETESLNNAINKLKATPQYKEAKAKADAEALGKCGEPCMADAESVDCKACQAGTSVSGYCAAHSDHAGC